MNLALYPLSASYIKSFAESIRQDAALTVPDWNILGVQEADGWVML